jgi:two-component system, NtrC family, nitrogen regulation sensor histidine kinase NtrY
LAIVRKIVEEHNGVLSLHDAPVDFYGGVGANIRLEFPLIQTSLIETQAALETNNEMKQVAENGI